MRMLLSSRVLTSQLPCAAPLSLRLAAALKLSFASLGFAGTKDKKAVTYQWVSIADRSPAQLCSGDTRSIAAGRP